jgi:hypothetical protein
VRQVTAKSGQRLDFSLEVRMSLFEDRAFSSANAAPSRTRIRSSVEKAAILIGMFACVIGMLFLAAEGLSKSTDWYEPTPMNFIGP